MKTAIVIPARYASKRLPGKPLLRRTGKYLIQHVYERARESKLADRVIVATDDTRIFAAAKSFGADVVMTQRRHPSGTDRIAEVVRDLDVDVVINLQGDEPLVDPEALDRLPQIMAEDPNADMATLAVPLRNRQQWLNPNCVKVVCDQRSRALYFSRSPIPFVRDGEPRFDADPPLFLQHLGLYAYRRPVLLRLASAQREPFEQLESLEQLRALALGYRIHVGVIQQTAIGVDTLEDYDRFVEEYRLALAEAA